MNIVKKLLHHELISGTFYIFLGSMIANVMAFLLNLFFARSLSYGDYGIFASLLSIITLAMIAGNSITTIIVKFSTGYYVKMENDKLKSFYKQMALVMSFFSAVVFLGFTVFSPIVSKFLNLDNYWYLVLVGVTVGIFYLQILNQAFIQGLMKFKYISILTVLISFVKLAAGVVFVYLGFRAFSGVWSILFMCLTAFTLGFIPLRKIIFESKEKFVNINWKEVFIFALPAFFTMLFMTSFTSTDVILVKHFFNPQLAAFYAGLSLVGKVIFYFTAPIPMVMFPLLVKRHTTGRNFLNVFYLSLLLVLLPSAVISVFYYLFPVFVIRLFLGGRDYIAVASYLGFFAIYLTVFSLVNVCVNFFLSLGKTKIVYPVILAALSQIILIYLFHNNFGQVIGISFVTSFVLLLVLLVAFVKVFGRKLNLKDITGIANTPSIET